MDFNEVVVICAFEIHKRKMKRKKRYWVHPLYTERLFKGKFYTIYSELRQYPPKFFNYFRMSINSFDELLALVGPVITHQDTRFRKAIPAEERLTVTLRYLASGASFNALSFEYLIGATTLRNIVNSTCQSIWEALQPLYMAEKNEEDWYKIADQFYERTNFPNIIGAVDGKHVRITNPKYGGSDYFNYKKYFSMVLMAWVDADYKFIYIDVGSQGSASDSTILKKSNTGRRLQGNLLNIPIGRSLPNDENGKIMPFCIVGDEAFGLSKNILRPFSKRGLTVAKRIFNYRHTRARRMVECTFGILCNKWRILHRPIDVNVEFCDKIVMACCILHNYVRVKDGIQFTDTAYECTLSNTSTNQWHRNMSCVNIRNYFTSYFISPQGSVPWQYEKI